MGTSKAPAAARSNAVDVPAISPGSPRSNDDTPSTPGSSPWRENPAFLLPGTSKPSPGSQPPASLHAAPRLRSSVSADLSDRLASMSVVGSGLQRVREVDSEAAQSSSVWGQADGEAGQGNRGVSASGRTNALGRLRDRQQQVPRKTADDDSQSKARPAKFYLQVPVNDQH